MSTTMSVELAVFLVVISLVLLLPSETLESTVTGGPTRERTTGRKMMAWNRPNTTVRVNVLKKVTKTWDEEKMRRMRAMKVVTPPLRTAGPMAVSYTHLTLPTNREV